MPRATYTLELELQYNIWTDVSADWHTPTPLVIERGLTPGERVAQVGRMTFALYSPDGRYLPGHPNARAGFEVGIGVRLRAHFGAQERTLFCGRVREIRPRRAATPHRIALQQVEVVCEDDMAALERTPTGAFPLIVNAAPGDLVEQLIRRSFIPRGRLAYWRLDHPQAGALGEGSRLSDAATGVDIAVGQSVFAWAGDSWEADLPCAAALREVCASEGGHFFIAADGTPTFTDRHARPRHIVAEATLEAGLAGISVERGAGRLANRVEVTTSPRAVGTYEGVLWEAGHTIRLAPGEARTIVCRYRDPDEPAAQVGAWSLVTPVPYTDFTATIDPQGLGNDLTDAIRVRVEAGGTSARLTLEHLRRTNRAVYVHNLRLRGVPLYRHHTATAQVEDAASLVTYGLHPLRVAMPLQDEVRVGEDMARALLTNRAVPQAWLTVTVEATADGELLQQALAREVGDRLHVTDAALGLEEAACFVDSVRHEVRRGGASHRVVWRTSPADLEAYWVLGDVGYGALGSATKLGY